MRRVQRDAGSHLNDFKMEQSKYDAIPAKQRSDDFIASALPAPMNSLIDAVPDNEPGQVRTS